MNQSPVQKLNGVFSSVLWLVFTILYTVYTAYTIVLQFSFGSIVNYVLSVLVCVGAWQLWLGAKKNQTKTSGLTLMSGVLITQIVFACIGAVIFVIVSLIMAVKVKAWIGLLMLVFSAIIFGLNFLYLKKLRDTVRQSREVLNTGTGDVTTSLFVIIVMILGIIGSLLSVIALAQAGKLLGLFMSEAAFYLDSSQYGMLMSVLGGTMGTKAVIGGLLNCASQVVAVIILLKMKNGLPDAEAAAFSQPVHAAQAPVFNQQVQAPQAPAFNQKLSAPERTCPNCGASVGVTAKFCTRCGQSISDVLASQQPVAEAPVFQQPAEQVPVFEQPAAEAPIFEQPEAMPTGVLNPSTPAETTILRAEPTGEIIGTAGQSTGLAFQLKNGETLTLGRDPAQCQILLPESNTSISRRHCSITFNAETESYCVTDYSSNGTFVGGIQLPKGQPQILNRGTEIALGNGEERFGLN